MDAPRLSEVEVEVHQLLVCPGLDLIQVINLDCEVEEINLLVPLLDLPLENAALEVVQVVTEAIPGARVSAVVPEAQAVINEPLVQDQMCFVFFEQAKDLMEGVVNCRVHAVARHPRGGSTELFEEFWPKFEHIVSHDDFHCQEEQIDCEVVWQLVSKLGNEVHENSKAMVGLDFGVH